MVADLDELIAGAPAREKTLLELEVRLEDAADPALAAAAGAIRAFLITWDPFEWVEDRKPAMATTIGSGPGAEAVIYAPHWRADLGAMARYVSSMIRTLAAHRDAFEDGTYAAEAFALRVPGLLSDIDAEPVDGLAVGLGAGGWQPLGHGAIEDMAIAEFGPMDLDRSPVSLEALDEPEEGCVACAGGVFEFPAELNGNLPAMCRPHRALGFALAQERFEAAAESNGDTWEAIEYASELLDVPHLPAGMRTELLDAASGFYERLSQRAEQLEAEIAEGGDPDGLPPIEADHEATISLFGRLAEAFADAPAEFEEAVADDIELLEDYLPNVAVGLRAAGKPTEALELVGALCQMMPSHRPTLLLGRAELQFELGDEAGAWTDLDEATEASDDQDWLIAISAAGIAADHGDDDRADRLFRQAMVVAQVDDEIHAGQMATTEYRDFLLARPDRADRLPEVEAQLEVWERRIRDASRGMSGAAKVGRNDPCPCGSGRKYKQCCGR